MISPDEREWRNCVIADLRANRNRIKALEFTVLIFGACFAGIVTIYLARTL